MESLSNQGLLPWVLQLSVQLQKDGSQKVEACLRDATGYQRVVELPLLKKGENFRTALLNFTLSTSPKPTSTESTYSKEELLTLLKRKGAWTAGAMSPQIEQFINEL